MREPNNDKIEKALNSWVRTTQGNATLAALILATGMKQQGDLGKILRDNEDLVSKAKELGYGQQKGRVKGSEGKTCREKLEKVLNSWNRETQGDATVTALMAATGIKFKSGAMKILHDNPDLMKKAVENGYGQIKGRTRGHTPAEKKVEPAAPVAIRPGTVTQPVQTAARKPGAAAEPKLIKQIEKVEKKRDAEEEPITAGGAAIEITGTEEPEVVLQKEKVVRHLVDSRKKAVIGKTLPPKLIREMGDCFLLNEEEKTALVEMIFDRPAGVWAIAKAFGISEAKVLARITLINRDLGVKLLRVTADGVEMNGEVLETVYGIQRPEKQEVPEVDVIASAMEGVDQLIEKALAVKKPEPAAVRGDVAEQEKPIAAVKKEGRGRKEIPRMPDVDMEIAPAESEVLKKFVAAVTGKKRTESLRMADSDFGEIASAPVDRERTDAAMRQMSSVLQAAGQMGNGPAVKPTQTLRVPQIEIGPKVPNELYAAMRQRFTEPKGAKAEIVEYLFRMRGVPVPLENLPVIGVKEKWAQLGAIRLINEELKVPLLAITPDGQVKVSKMWFADFMKNETKTVMSGSAGQVRAEQVPDQKKGGSKGI
ncbi:Uncharacterised protein [Candidatus Gugararchaeum adminiculabundum]|nr:Uncharacterised protein [Candidatus Gugararchaeum adminiculabundum]